MTIDRTDPRPPYWQIAEQLRSAIYEGRLEPGARLPSERELMERYDVSNATVRRAIRVLQSDGLIDTEAGRGVFVRRRRPLIHMSPSFTVEQRSWRSELERQGQVGRQELLEVDVVTPEREILERLELTDEDPVLVRRRLLYVDDEPVQISDGYYPYRLVQNTPLALKDKVLIGSLRALRQAGVELRRVTEDLTVRMPRPEEASMLRLGPGIPVIRMIRIVYDASATPVELSEIIISGERHVLHYEVEL